MLTFDAYGIPAPQGSKSAYVRNGHAVLAEQSKGLPAWRDAVIYAAHLAIQEARHEMITGPATLDVTFYMPRPRSAPRTRDILPTVAPDTDKLLRAVGDALTYAGVWRDDCLAVELCGRKRYAVSPDLKFYNAARHRTTTGASIVVRKLDIDGQEIL